MWKHDKNIKRAFVEREDLRDDGAGQRSDMAISLFQTQLNPLKAYRSLLPPQGLLLLGSLKQAKRVQSKPTRLEQQGQHRAAGLLITQETTHPLAIHRNIQNTHLQLRSFTSCAWKHSYTHFYAFIVFKVSYYLPALVAQGRVVRPASPVDTGSHPTLLESVSHSLGRNTHTSGCMEVILWGSGSVALLGCLLLPRPVS